MIRPHKYCDNCKYDAFGPLCDNAQCEYCPLFMYEPAINITGHRVHCKCLTVKDDEECPYYEEVTTDAEET